MSDMLPPPGPLPGGYMQMPNQTRWEAWMQANALQQQQMAHAHAAAMVHPAAPVYRPPTAAELAEQQEQRRLRELRARYLALPIADADQLRDFIFERAVDGNHFRVEGATSEEVDAALAGLSAKTMWREPAPHLRMSIWRVAVSPVTRLVGRQPAVHSQATAEALAARVRSILQNQHNVERNCAEANAKLAEEQSQALPGDARVAILAWFLFYLGGIWSAKIILDALRVRRFAREAGVAVPVAARRALRLGVLPFVVFPAIAIAIELSMH